MSAHERQGVPGLLLRQARADSALLVLVSGIVALAALLLCLGPGTMRAVADRELRHTLSGFPAPRHDLTAAGWFGTPAGPSPDPAQAQNAFDAITTVVEGVTARTDPPLETLLDPPDWAVTTPRQAAEVRGRNSPLGVAYVLGLTATPRWHELVRYVEGDAPGVGAADGAIDDAGAPVPAAVSAAAAKRLGLGIGDVVDVDDTALVITGVFEAADPTDPLWSHRTLLLSPADGRAEDGRIAYTADVLIAPGSTARLADAFEQAQVDAWYPTRIDDMAFAEIPVLAEQIRALSTAGIGLPSHDELVFSPALASDLDDVATRVATATALLALLVAGPIGVLLAVLALAAGAIADRRAAALRLARVRGASGVQLRGAMALEGFAVALPAALIGVGIAAALTGGRMTPPDVVPAALVALALPLLLAVAVPAPAGRARGGGWRWVVELLVAGLAAASLFLLFRRPLSAGTGVDPLLVLAPLLVAAAVTVVVLRVHPWLMGAVRRSTRRGRGAVGLVGAARALPVPAVGTTAAFALVIGVAMAVFSAGMASSIAGALARAAAAARTDDGAVLDAGHPLVAAMFAVLALGAALSLALCVVAVVIAVLAAGRERNRAIGVLRVLGFAPGQIRGLVAWELAPLALVAIVAGVGLGVAETFVLTTAIDLPAFAGTRMPAVVDPLAVVGIAAVFAVAALAAAAIATMVARRRSPASTIRMGME